MSEGEILQRSDGGMMEKSEEGRDSEEEILERESGEAVKKRDSREISTEE